MENKTLFDKFTRQYQLSKTLRFELVPQGETERFIKDKGLLEKDEKRAEDYKAVKKLIDEYHKDFIENALSDKKLSDLNDYLKEFTKPERDNEVLSIVSDLLRKEIAGWLKDNPIKDEKKLIEEKVPVFLKQQGRSADAELILKFKGFTTYFGGFNDNRKNIYSDKEQSTAIAYRIVNENLPKFISNMNTFHRLNENYKIDFQEVEAQLNGSRLKDIFSLDYFNHCLTQSGIEQYNAIVGGKTDDKGNKIQGINEKINLFRQKNNLTGRQAPILAPLYKQILSDRVSASYLPEKFESADELVRGISKFYEEAINGFIKGNEKKNLFAEIEGLLRKLNVEGFDLSKIYISKTGITAVSQQMFGSYALITNALHAYIEKECRTKKEKEKQEKKSYFSISEIETALKAYLQETEIENNEKREEFLKQENPALRYFQAVAASIETAVGRKEKANLTANLRQKHEAVQSVLNNQYENNSELIQDKKAVAVIKDYLDSYLHILHFVKPLYVAPPKKDDSEMPERDAAFYNEFDELFRQLNGTVIPLYNKVRSFLTQKPYSTEKFKLNFENGYLLSGWAQDYEAKGGLIFKTDDNYYLGILEKKFTGEDIVKLKQNDQENPAVRIVYDFQKPDNKNIPRLFIRSKGENFSPAVKELNLPIDNVVDIYDSRKFTTEYKKENQGEFKESLIKLIDYFKDGFKKHASYKHFNFLWKESSLYNDISEFYKDVENSCYQLSEEKINFNILLQYVKENKLYLFKIYNKDFSSNSKGKPNLHTMYWKALFEEDNLKDVVYKLNGQAEIFYRPVSILERSKFVHPRNIPIDKKNPNSTGKPSSFEYDIVKDRRFTQDKYQFHVPITVNFKSANVPSDNDRAKAFAYKFNSKVNQYLQEYTDVKILGIDRGERHLAYYSLINSKGEIIEQQSFNVIRNEYNGAEYKTDYQKNLTEKEKARDTARKSWDTIGKIKELKEGYLSQVVHKIAQLMIKHNAVVVFEDLNFGFKRGRMKVERQVYQKLEKMLIDKLNYLVFKDHEATEPGGIMNAYQLAAPFTSFRDMGKQKQTGFIFYIPAANTSKIDFATGFVNLLYPKYEKEKQAKDFFNNMEGIRYNAANDFFEFEVDYNKFRTDKTEQLNKGRWTICTVGDERYQYQPSKKEYSKVNVTEGIKGLLKKQGIEFNKGSDLKKAVTAVENAQFFKDLIFYLKLTLQMRYTDGKDRDFILSPVADKNGVFFNSEKAADAEPKDADANGAYHIALKGLLQLQKIRAGEKKLAVTNKEWHDFVQERAYRK